MDTATTYDARLPRAATISDEVGDETRVMVDGTYVHVVIFDQTLSDGLDEDHEPDGGYPDSARGVYTPQQARELAAGLLAAADAAEKAAR